MEQNFPLGGICVSFQHGVGCVTSSFSPLIHSWILPPSYDPSNQLPVLCSLSLFSPNAHLIKLVTRFLLCHIVLNKNETNWKRSLICCVAPRYAYWQQWLSVSSPYSPTSVAPEHKTPKATRERCEGGTNTWKEKGWNLGIQRSGPTRPLLWAKNSYFPGLFSMKWVALHQWFPKYGPLTSSVTVTWHLVTNANSKASL